jgi:hypothetical protein
MVDDDFGRSTYSIFASDLNWNPRNYAIEIEHQVSLLVELRIDLTDIETSYLTNIATNKMHLYP